MNSKLEREHNLCDLIVAAFSDLECVQEQIPPGYILHVKCLWDRTLPTLLPVGLKLELLPVGDTPADAVILNPQPAEGG